MYFRCTPTEFGPSVTHDTGGYYERIEHGSPQLVTLGDYAGFKQSTTPAICASHSPEASLFAAAHNGTPGDYHIYRTDQEPDVDLSNSLYDFNIIEEVRYQHPEDDPVEFTRVDTVSVPERAIADINLSYVPHGPHIIREWAIGVRDTLSDTVLHDPPARYPDEISTVIQLERPDPDAFRDPYEHALA